MQPAKQQGLDKKHQQDADSSLAARIGTDAWHSLPSFFSHFSLQYVATKPCPLPAVQQAEGGWDREHRRLFTCHGPLPPQIWPTKHSFTKRYNPKLIYTHPVHYPDPQHRTPAISGLLGLAFCFLTSDWNLPRHSQIPYMYLQDCFWMGAMSHSLSWVSPPPFSVIASLSTLSKSFNAQFFILFLWALLPYPAYSTPLHVHDPKLLRLTTKWLGPQRHLLSGQLSTLTTLSQDITGLQGSLATSVPTSLHAVSHFCSFSGHRFWGKKNQPTG